MTDFKMCYEYLFFKNANEVPGLNITNINRQWITFYHPDVIQSKKEEKQKHKLFSSTSTPPGDPCRTGSPVERMRKCALGRKGSTGSVTAACRASGHTSWMCVIHLNKQTPDPLSLHGAYVCNWRSPDLVLFREAEELRLYTESHSKSYLWEALCFCSCLDTDKLCKVLYGWQSSLFE